jgi:DNA mismatch repair protein MutS
MFAQYLRVKEQVGDALLFFRLGDFYELFFEDAERAAPLLDLTLTSRNRDDPNPIPMCGVPHHAAQGYVSRLVAQGHRVAICDQVGALPASGLIERELTRIITPGTLLDEEEGLETREPGYLAAVASDPAAGFAIAVVEVSTGEIRCCETAVAEIAREEIARIAPREVLVAGEDEASLDLARASGAAVTLRPSARDAAAPGGPGAASPDETRAALGRLAATPLSPLGERALRAAVEYLAETVRGSLTHLGTPRVYELGQQLCLDERTRRNLAVLEGANGGGRAGSLWWVIDKSATAMGSRRVREWLVSPTLDLATLDERHGAIEALVEAPGLRADLLGALKPIGDFARLVARIGIGRAGPRELRRIGQGLERTAHVASLLACTEASLLARAAADAVPPEGLADTLLERLADSPPVSAAEGGAIRDGADPEVDRLRSLLRDAKGWIAALEAREREATGIGSLKVRYHRVLGYFFEVTKANLGKVPAHFVRRQSMASGERFSTAELADLERQLATAEDRCREREVELCAELLSRVAEHERRLIEIADTLATVDALAGLAHTAHEGRYVRPRLHRGTALRIREGRHPVVERTSAAGAFVPNDTALDDGDTQIAVLTGPNMAGKSTYLRQVALIVLLAHAGCFVPAAEAEIPLTDRIWTRVGASDDLVAGDSTFMVEMKETAAILANLTPRTLVVLDEIGRGTSTYDGIAIAWAVAEYLHELEPAPGRRVKTLFATHFHELTALADVHRRVRNFSVAVREWRDDVMFLRRVVAGPASRSFGVAVARLAGVPDAVVTRARELLGVLEKGGSPAGDAGASAGRAGAPDRQLDLFAAAATDAAAELQRELAAIDAETLTPLEALQRLHELAARARRQGGGAGGGG